MYSNAAPFKFLDGEKNPIQATALAADTGWLCHRTASCGVRDGCSCGAAALLLLFSSPLRAVLDSKPQL